MTAINHIFIIFILSFLQPSFKDVDLPNKLSETEKWKLGWRMVMSSMSNDYKLGELQFDSLLATKSKIDKRFVLTGLEILNKKNKNEKVHKVLAQLDDETLEFICQKELFTQKLIHLEVCKPFTNSLKIENPELQIELIKMYINDQVARGGNMDKLISKHKLIKEEVVKNKDGMSTDAENRKRLKEIFVKHGFPTKELVGADALQGIFLMIQHSDEDKEWQKSQLPNIKKSVKDGDMDGQSYAYLYDRIKINGGEKQLYGTQFAKVDSKNKIVELAPTEDLGNLDKRRMEIGMMPIEIYKKFMLMSMKN
jgi:hypothetical protein